MEVLNFNSIQIGDWLRSRYKDRGGYEIVKDFRVDSLIRDHTLEIGVYSDLGFMGYAEQMEPIPLTAEILEKNFEKKTFYGIFDDFFDLEIREYSDSVYVVTYHNCEMNFTDQVVLVSFVHELQHFLNLLGIEKEITL